MRQSINIKIKKLIGLTLLLVIKMHY